MDRLRSNKGEFLVVLNTSLAPFSNNFTFVTDCRQTDSNMTTLQLAMWLKCKIRTPAILLGGENARLIKL